MQDFQQVQEFLLDLMSPIHPNHQNQNLRLKKRLIVNTKNYLSLKSSEFSTVNKIDQDIEQTMDKNFVSADTTPEILKSNESSRIFSKRK